MKYDDDFRTNLLIEMLVEDYKDLYEIYRLNANSENLSLEDLLYDLNILDSYEDLLRYYLPENKAQEVILDLKVGLPD